MLPPPIICFCLVLGVHLRNQSVPRDTLTLLDGPYLRDLLHYHKLSSVTSSLIWNPTTVHRNEENKSELSIRHHHLHDLNLTCTNGFFSYAKPGPDWCRSTPKTYSHQEEMDVWFLSRPRRQLAVFLAHFHHHPSCLLHGMLCSHYQWNRIKGWENLHFVCTGLVGKANRNKKATNRKPAELSY